MASIHKDPRGKSPFWYCAYTLPDGRRVFRSTKQRDRKKALAMCLKLGEAAQAAKAGELTELAARKNLDDILESVGVRPIRSETVRSFSTTWLASKKALHHAENPRVLQPNTGKVSGLSRGACSQARDVKGS